MDIWEIVWQIMTGRHELPRQSLPRQIFLIKIYPDISFCYGEF